MQCFFWNQKMMRAQQWHGNTLHTNYNPGESKLDYCYPKFNWLRHHHLMVHCFQSSCTLRNDDVVLLNTVRPAKPQCIHVLTGHKLLPNTNIDDKLQSCRWTKHEMTCKDNMTSSNVIIKLLWCEMFHQNKILNPELNDSWLPLVTTHKHEDRVVILRIPCTTACSNFVKITIAIDTTRKFPCGHVIHHFHMQCTWELHTGDLIHINIE